jgi:YVTN family beta-propeller protein
MKSISSAQSGKWPRAVWIGVVALLAVCGVILLTTLLLPPPTLANNANTGSVLSIAQGQPLGSGGPDAFGYTFKDSNEPDGPIYAWEEIDTTGTQVTNWCGYDDCYGGPVPIGFGFDYYGNSYDELYVGTNGYVSFGQGYGTIPWGSLPQTSDPNNDIALFGGDMYLYNYGYDSVVYYQTLSDPTRFVLEFVNLYYCCGQNTPHTFEVILYPDGDILAQYQSLNGTSTDYVGIENVDGTDGLGYGATLSDSLAIRYYYPVGVFLTPSSVEGFAEAGSTVTYTLWLANQTEATDSFTLTLLPGNNWTTTLSLTQTGTLADGDSVSFDVSVQIPPAGSPGDADSAMIQATSVTSPTIFSDTATLTTTVGGALAYVTLSGSDLVALVDTATHSVIGSVNVGAAGCNFPWRATMSPDGNFVYVGCYNSGNVAVIETAGNSVATVVAGIPNADGVAFTRDGAYALVGSRWSAQIAVIDTATYFISFISTPDAPRSIIAHPYLDRAYATCADGTTLVIDTTAFSILTAIPVGSEPWDVAISPSGQWVFASDRQGGGLAIIDTTSDTLYTTVTGLGDLTGLEVAPDGSEVYACGLWNGVHVVDGLTFDHITTISGVGNAWEAAITCDGSELYVGDVSEQIPVIDTATYSVADQITMPGYTARGITICPQHVASGVFLSPPAQTDSGARGEVIAHEETLVNITGATDSFDLTLGSHAWDTVLSTDSLGPIADGDSATFTVYVTVPTGVDWYTTDTVVVTATSVISPTVYSDAASFTTQAYAPPEIGVSPDELTSTQYVNEIVDEELTISNGNAVTLTFELSEFDSGLSRVTACASSSSDGLAYPAATASLAEPEPCGAGTTAYVTLRDSSLVSLVNTATYNEIGTVNVGAAGCDAPWQVAMSPDGDYVYVGCRNSGNVAVIETASNTVVTTVGGIDGADGIAFTRDGAYALVGSRWNSQVAVVDTVTYSVVTYINTPSNARSVAAHPHLDLAYATSGDGTIQVIDTTTFGIIASVPVGSDPHDVAASPDGQWVFAGSRWGDGLAVVDADSNTLHTTVTGLGDLTGLKVAPDGSEVYACGLGNGVHVIDGVTFDHITTVPNVGETWEAAVTCDGSELYVGNKGNQVPVIDTTTYSVSQQIPMSGYGAHGIAICPQHFGGDVLWLSMEPISGTVPTNSSVPVQVTFDATGMQPDTYSAQIVAWSNDPMTPAVFVPVAMTVEPTANMGWVEGTVTDTGTGNPLEATIIALGQPYTVTTNPDTGAYIFWLDEGSYTLQVTAEGYVPETAEVEIVAQQGTTQDFALVLDVPVLQVSPDGLEVTHEVGDVTTEWMTITNAGPADLTFELAERDTTSGLALLEAYARSDEEMAALLAEAESTADPNNEGPPRIARIPASEFLHLEGTTRILAWTAYADYWQEYTNSLNAIAQYTTFELTETTTSDPEDLGNLLADADVFLLPEQEYADYWTLHGIGTTWVGVLADFVSDGGTVVALDHCNQTTGLVQGAGLMDLEFDGCSEYITVEVVEPDHPLAEDLPTTFSGDNGTGYYSSTNGLEIVQVQSNGMTVVAARDIGIGHVVMAGFDFYDYNDAMARLLANAVLWYGSADVPWLSEEPISGTVSGYSSLPVEVIFNATGTQPGDYTADIIVQSNDPVTPSVSLPVTMIVLPSADLGRVVGAVSDAWSGLPLTATVELVGVYSMTASPDFSIWAPAGTYSLSAYTAGYYTVTVPVTIIAGETVTQNLTLEPAQPRLEWTPDVVAATATEGTQVTQTLVISNSGPLPLEITLHEISPTLALRAPAPEDLTGKQILYDRAHDEPGMWDYSTLITDAIGAGAEVTENWYYPIDASVLEGYDVLWVNCCGYTSWTFDELNAVSDWLAEGGAVFVQGESSPATDGPASVYGISYQSASCTSGTTTNITEHPISEGVDAVNVEWTCWRLVTGGGAAIVVYDPQGQPHVVAREQDGGRMVVVASEDFTDWHIDYDDNRLLANNILAWLAQPAYSDVPWLSETPDEATVPGHSSLAVTLAFDAGTLGVGSHEAILAVEHNDPAQGSPLELPVTLTVVERQAGLSLVPPSQEGSGYPGETVIYSFTVTNEGNYTDTFSLETSALWTPTLSVDSTGPLGVGESFAFTLEVAIPATADEGSSDLATIRARSEFDPEVVSSAQVTTTAVEQQAGLSLLPPSQEGSGLPGETVVYSLTVTNLGNYTDTFSLEASGLWTAAPSVGSTGPLGAGESFVFTLEVAIPASADEGSSDLATVTAQSEFDPGVSSSAQVTTAALRPHGWQVYLPLVLKNSE